MPDIGKRIKKRRQQMGWTQDELAEKTGYKSRSSINKIEKGGNYLPQSKIVLFAKVLQTTPSYLIGWEDSPEDSITTRHQKIPPLKLDLFGGTDKNTELLQEINERLKNNPVISDDEMSNFIVEVFKRLPEKKRKEILLTFLDLLTK